MDSCCPELKPSSGHADALKAVLAINALMFLVEAAAGLRFDSRALLADSLDMLADAAAYAATLYAALRGPREKAGASLFKGLLMGFSGLGVLSHVLWTAFIPHAPRSLGMAATAFLAAAANGACMLILYKYREDDLNMRSVWLCSRNDVLANLGVIGAAGAVSVLGASWPDTAVGAVIAGVILSSAAAVIKESWEALNSAGETPPSQTERIVEHAAGLGAGLSLLCAVHCLLLPLLVVVAPLIGLGVVVKGAFEGALIASALILAVGTLFIGFRQHRRLEPAALLGAGIAGIIASHFLTPPKFEPFIMAAAGLFLAAAQILNRRHCRACAHCASDPADC